jgi:hypothetical protein
MNIQELRAAAIQLPETVSINFKDTNRGVVKGVNNHALLLYPDAVQFAQGVR